MPPDLLFFCEVRAHTAAPMSECSASNTPDPNGVFYSGGRDVQELVGGACARLDLTLLGTRSPKDYAAALKPVSGRPLTRRPTSERFVVDPPETEPLVLVGVI